MLTLDSVKEAILEILDGSEDLTDHEIYSALRTEMHPAISDRDAAFALESLLSDGTVQTRPTLYHRTSNRS